MAFHLSWARGVFHVKTLCSFYLFSTFICCYLVSRFTVNTLSKQFFKLFPESLEICQHNSPLSCVRVLSILTKRFPLIRHMILTEIKWYFLHSLDWIIIGYVLHWGCNLEWWKIKIIYVVIWQVLRRNGGHMLGCLIIDQDPAMKVAIHAKF